MSVPDGPVFDWQPPKGAHIEYVIAWPDPHPYMDGPKTLRQGNFKTPEAAQAAFDKVYKRIHPEAWIEYRLVYPWEKFNG